MELHIRSQQNVAVIAIDGSVNNETLHHLSRALDSALSAGCPNLILDLAKTKILLSSGMGLFIAKKIVEQHGGTIAATSSPGIGTTFTVDLPVDPEVNFTSKDARSSGGRR